MSAPVAEDNCAFGPDVGREQSGLDAKLSNIKKNRSLSAGARQVANSGCVVYLIRDILRKNQESEG